MKQSPVAAAADASEASTPAASAPTNGSDGDRETRILAEVEKVIAAVRPAVQADRGDVVLVSVDSETGVVEVELQGACTSCPASSQTLKAGIERIMRDRIPEVTEVVNVGQLYYDDGTAVTL